MTLRTDAALDEALARLADRWGVTKSDAVRRAVAEADAGRTLESDALAAYERVSERYRDALDRLGSV